MLLCSGHGTCPESECVCSDGWQGPLCDEEAPICGINETLIDQTCIANECIFPVLGGHEPTVCNGVGMCVYKHGEYRCLCESGYKLISGMGCMPLDCYDVDTGALCAQGECVQGESGYRCKCDTGYVSFGNRCLSTDCVALVDGQPTECSGMGKCVANQYRGVNGGSYSCKCRDPMMGELCQECNEEVGHVIDGSCVHESCVDFDEEGEALECGGAGLCEEVAEVFICACQAGALPLGRTCVFETCVSDIETMEVCGGHGACKVGVCQCERGWKGQLCQATTSSGLSGGAIAGIVLGVLAVLVAITLGIYFGLRRRKRSYAQMPGHGEGEESRSSDSGAE